MITARGLLKYGGALRIVHEALAKDDASRSFDLLEAVMIMALIEVSLIPVVVDML